MDNHIFRGAALGFNRQDVMEYIERTQKQAEENAARLRRRLEREGRVYGVVGLSAGVFLTILFL